MTSRKPDFKRVYMLANEILVVTRTIDTFPYSVKQLAMEQADVQVCSFKKAQEKYKIPIKDFGSESAHLEEYMGAHIIFFNEQEEKYRVRFSIGHELGHMLLEHDMNLKKENPLYGVQEVEANCFSAQLLMPEQLLRECNNRGYKTDVDYIIKSFGVSEDAAQRRKNTLAKNNYEWRNRSEKMFDDIIIERNLAFLDKIAPRRRVERFNSFFYDEEMDMQKERYSWLDTRRRW
ncbi:protein of unknown function [Butyrivibrio sp. INlla14]|nr:protein of unknown function [Butyrivibrio sp. INlla14]